MKKIKVEVTAADIRKARRLKGNRSTTCPVALAVQRVTKDPKAWAGVTFMYTNGKYIPTPKKNSEFILRFDAGKPVKPFSFTISL